MEEKILNEKVEEKVESKSVNKPKQAQYKECDVLVYNAKEETIVISFDGLGYELKGIKKDPGETVRVKVSGKTGTSNFKLALA